MTRSARSILTAHRLAWAILAALLLAAAGLAGPAPGRAQAPEGVTETFYAYVSEDGATIVTLMHLEPEDPEAAGDLLDPAFVDSYLDRFRLLTDEELVEDLDPDQAAQLEGADAYTVFTGTLDFPNGAAPGYVLFVSAAQQVFVIAGYEQDAEAVFALAARAIEEGMPPLDVEGFTRIDQPGLAGLDQATPELATPEVGLATPAGETLCIEEPTIGLLDADGDGVVTIAELEDLADVPEVSTLLTGLEAAGVGGIAYSDC